MRRCGRGRLRNTGWTGAKLCGRSGRGGDYTREAYPDGCVVIDNPPFSILKKIKDFYNARGIAFFLFAPHLTLFSVEDGATNYIIADTDVTYENGAVVKTDFTTNLGADLIRTAPELRRAIRDADKRSRKAKKLPRYEYPANVISAALLGKIAKVDFRLTREECYFVRSLDAQREKQKVIFGGGYLISDSKAAELREAELRVAEPVTVWELSEAEQKIIAGLRAKGTLVFRFEEGESAG